MAPIKTVAIAGASGLLGTPIVKGLLDAGIYEVSALVRKSSKATFPAGVKVIQVDYNLEDLAEALKGQDAVISTLGGESLQLEHDLIDAAVKAGVKRYLPSEFGSSTSYKPLLDRVPMFITKAGNSAYAKSKEGQGLTWTRLYTGAFTDFCIKVGFFGLRLDKQEITYYGAGTKRWSSTPLYTVGKAVAAILSPEHYDETSNKLVAVQSFALNAQDLKAAAERVTGKPFTVTETIDAVALREDANKRFAAGDHAAMAEILQSAMFGDDGAGLFADEGGYEIWNDRLGLPKDNLDDVVRYVLDGKA